MQLEKLQNPKPRILLVGMPNADSSFFEMNIGQLPQGPEVTAVRSFPKLVREKVNGVFIDIFNPTKKTPYMGMRLIIQNLQKYIDFSLIEYPKSDREITDFIRHRKDIKIIGISIGCENRVYQAKALAMKIRDIRPNIKIVFGNYGAVAGKKLGILTEKEGFVLWDSEEERKTKKALGEDFYSGEGIHDMRLWLQRNGIYAGDPHAPLISNSIPDPDLLPNNAIARWISEKSGFTPMTNDSNKIGVSIGCTNNCSFCNTRYKFNRSKTFLYRKAEELFHVMEQVVEKNNAMHDYPPEGLFFLMDENFMKDEEVNSGEGKINFLDVAEKLCKLIAESENNIHWGTFSDVKSLLAYKKRHKSYIGLVRGGLQSVWVGLESREDVFDKRGQASSLEVEEMIKEMQSLGITIIGSFIPGLSIHTEGENKKKYDSIRLLSEHIESNNELKIKHWFNGEADKLMHIIGQIFSDSSKEKVLEVFNILSQKYQDMVSNILGQYHKKDSDSALLLRENKNDLLQAFSQLISKGKDDLVSLFKQMLKNDKFESLNIWEDIDWWIKQNTACRQVMMYSITGVVGHHDYMIKLSDQNFGHMEIPGYNQSQISGKRLEWIDRKARSMFYESNGPVTINSLLTFWDGFMNLKNSGHPSDIKAATYYYWMAKRYLHQISLATFFFNDKLFTKCSDKFLSRLAKMFQEIEKYRPSQTTLYDKYQSVFDIYDAKVWRIFKTIGDVMRQRFIKKHLQAATV